MAKNNFYTVEKEINSVTYRAQFNGISAALKAIDASYIDGTSTTSLEKLSKYLLEHVIIEPRNLTPDDFESLEEFNQVIAFARETMQGENAPAKDEKKEK